MPVTLRATAAATSSTATAVAKPTTSTRRGTDIGAELDAELDLAESQLSLAMNEADEYGDPLLSTDYFDSTTSRSDAAAKMLAVEEAETALARLEHLVRLVRDARGDRLPINGVALLVPVEAIETQHHANVVASLVSQELDTVAAAAGATAPAVAVVTDIDQLTGCDGLLRSLPAQRRDRRLGTAMSLDGKLDGDALSEKVGDSVAWISTLVGSLCYRLFRADDAETDRQRKTNSQLYTFQHELADRQRNLKLLLERGLAACHDPWPIAGCFLTASGQGPTKTPGFGAGILGRLLDVRHHAQWTPATLQHDRQQHRLAWLCWSATAGMVALGAVLCWVCG
jgi:hypothetical protein